MSYRVLLVEDNSSQAQRFQLELQRHGLEAHVAHSGPDGLIIARHHQLDAIVLNGDLPGMGGDALCRALKSDPVTADIPIVMLTRRDHTGRGDVDEWVAELRHGGAAERSRGAGADQRLVASLRQLGLI